MRKILLTGANSFLGGHLYKALFNSYIAYGTYNSNRIRTVNFLKLNLIGKGDVLKILNEVKPDIVIQNAAVSDPDDAEVNKKIAWLVNVESTEIIADWCNKNRAKLLYISTDQVFDGLSSYYKETDKANPINFYGKTKVEAENIVLASNKNAVIRMALMYGRGVFNISYRQEWLWNTLAYGKGKIKIIYDQYRSLLCVNNAADLIKELCDIDFSGLIHIGGPERISRYDFAIRLCNFLNRDYNERIEKVSYKEVHYKAVRPKDVSFDITKAKSILRTPILTTQEALSKYYT